MSLHSKVKVKKLANLIKETFINQTTFENTGLFFLGFYLIP